MRRRDVADWLRDNVTCGDLVLSGGSDRLSRLIQWGTLSDYSHAALALNDETFLESYDWSGTPAQNDDGVATIDIDQYAARGGLRRLTVLRPDALDHDRFCDVAHRVTQHSPAFASTVGVLLALAGIGDHPKFRIPAASSFFAKRLHLLGDGAARVTCSELAARVYLEAGLPLRFQTLRLIRYIELLRSIDWEPLSTDADPRQICAEDLSEAEQTSLVAYVADLPHALARASSERTQPDWADLVVPGDFLHSSNFRVVARTEVP